MYRHKHNERISVIGCSAAALRLDFDIDRCVLSNVQEFERHFALLLQLIGSRHQLLAGEVGHGNTIDNGPFAA